MYLYVFNNRSYVLILVYNANQQFKQIRPRNLDLIYAVDHAHSHLILILVLYTVLSQKFPLSKQSHYHFLGLHDTTVMLQ